MQIIRSKQNLSAELWNIKYLKKVVFTMNNYNLTQVITRTLSEKNKMISRMVLRWFPNDFIAQFMLSYSRLKDIKHLRASILIK